MSTAADYVDRRFDLLALRGARARGEVLLDQSIIGPQDGGEICAGVQKLAQNWAIRFLTIVGSKKFDPTFGTEFMWRVRRGGFRTEADVRSEFNFANTLVRQQLINSTPVTAPLDEQFASANLLRIVIAPELFILYVNIVSQAGDNREVLLPIGLLPVQLT